MTPFSRGTKPIEYSIRVTCELGENIILSSDSESFSLQINNKICNILNDNENVIIEASGFNDENEGRSFFSYLQNYLANWSLINDISISIPSTIEHPSKADHSIPGSLFSKYQDISDKEINPLFISNIGAWVYPEHEFVFINKLVKIKKKKTHTLNSLFAPEKSNNVYSPNQTIDERLLFAVIGYTHAKNSNMYVWSFLLSVTSLEMLANYSQTSEETIAAVQELIKYSNENYSKNENIDINRINSCIKQADKISITSAVKNLVKKYCAPTIANEPLGHLYSTPKECEQLISVIYNLRSKYIHEGMIKKSSKIKHSFHQLHDTLLQTLRHILKCMISDSGSIPNENT